MNLSNFVLSFNIPPWLRRPQLWATGDWQLHHDNAPASCLMQSFLAKHQITQVTQPLYSPDLAPCDFWLFPKLKSPLKGKRLQIVDEIQENTRGQMMANGRTVWCPKVPTECSMAKASLPYVEYFLCLVSSSINVSIFSYYMAGYLLDRPYISLKLLSSTSILEQYLVLIGDSRVGNF